MIGREGVCDPLVPSSGTRRGHEGKGREEGKGDTMSPLPSSQVGFNNLSEGDERRLLKSIAINGYQGRGKGRRRGRLQLEQ